MSTNHRFLAYRTIAAESGAAKDYLAAFTAAERVADAKEGLAAIHELLREIAFAAIPYKGKAGINIKSLLAIMRGVKHRSWAGFIRKMLVELGRI
jgi:hypothetical protein